MVADEVEIVRRVLAHIDAGTTDEGGTSGFIAGRSIWKDAVGMEVTARRSFLADEGRRRLDNLVQVIDGRARPYTEVTAR